MLSAHTTIVLEFYTISIRHAYRLPPRFELKPLPSAAVASMRHVGVYMVVGNLEDASTQRDPTLSP